MKIAVLTTDNRDHCRDYAKTSPYFGTAPEALLQGFAGISGVEVHVVSCTQRPMASPEKLAANIWFHSLHVPKIGWLRTVYQGCIRAVRNRLKEINPDIVHGQGTERDCAISAVFSGYPNVLTIHGNMRLIAKVEKAKPLTFLWLAAKLERFCLPRSDGIVCITNYTRDAVASLANQTWVLPNAVDARFFDINAAPNLEEPPGILYVGAVGVRKNQNAFIRSLDSLAKQQSFKITFLGQAHRGNPYTDEFFNLVESRPWCSYEGFADRDKLRGYFQKASLLVLASLEDNCPMVVLEAMAAGVPVIAPEVGGVPDLIQHRMNGLFCDPLNPASMRECVSVLLHDRKLAQDLAGQAKKDAQKRFHPIVVAQKHLEIYREVLTRVS
jgi:glycosyltransferase involved in cell wall biosynthesis